MARARNVALAALLREAGWSQPQAAAAVARVAAESGTRELEAISRSHIAMWVQGTQPSGRAPHILRETLSRRLGRRLTLAELGLEGEPTGTTDSGSDWSVDPLTVLAELGSDDLDMHRRKLLATTAYSAAGLALPPASWWAAAPAAAAKRPAVSPRLVTQADIEDVRDLTTFYSARDQQRGGASGRSALAGHLRDEAVPLLGSRFRTEQIRRDTYSAVAEMTYLAGWMAFDASEHRTAQRYLTLAARIAAEAGDGPLGGHILRALAHQAVDLGHPRRALALADASMSQDRYGQASHREKALLAIVHARALAADGDRAGTLAAISRAERDLSRADNGDAPSRVGFFQEASLAHETACALRDMGQPLDAEIHFQRSVATRRRQQYARTHSVTLGYLGAVQARQGRLDEACATWNQALNAMVGVQSGRARDVIVRMQSDLSPIRQRGGRHVVELDHRARDMLRAIG
ncbi:55.5 kDa and 49.5 kDa sporulation protein [Streptomyces sp. 111WW2]|uniref:Tat pathway signal protein n=1 Tax=unclassified Streptomyces TaxID=2593676 RepID=UPI000D2BBD31|nr:MULTISPECIES: Tat pathway signal protein [unclassified Streptomyces]MDX3402533.1 Tat pathway signal protein [Streptomyces sp. ME01-18h]PSK58434.1 55.5 kDa and 49.5 kDa sporulation protein [Streptomyces sp. 111WW2]